MPRATRGLFGVLAFPVLVALGPGAVLAHDASAWGGLFRTRDAGATWLPVNPASFVSGALAVGVSPVDPHHLLLATDTGLSRSRNGGRDWVLEAQGVLIGPFFAVAFDVDGEREIDAVALDPSDPDRLWSVAAGQVFRTDDHGRRWRRVGVPLPDQPLATHALAAVDQVIVVATDRGVYRSADAGAQWSLVGDNLPAHLDAGLLAREPQSHATMYAGFSLTSRRELLRRASEGGGALRRLDL